MADGIEDIQKLFKAAHRSGPGSDSANPEVEEMRLNRQAVLRKQAGYGAGSIQYAIGRPMDPMFYWQNSSLPYNIWKRTELIRVREISRLLYLTHPLIGAAIDIYTTYPLVGMEMTCPKSQDVADFYNDLFFDQLDYEEFLIDLGREHWIAGEGFALGTFNDILGTWENDEILLPEDVKVVKSPFLKDPRYEIKLPEYIRKILIERKPEREYMELITQYPALAAYATDSGSLTFQGENDEDDNPTKWMQIDNSLIYQLKRKGDTFHERGVPILLRAFRSIVQEEMLNAAQDAVSSRLYTPLILAKIGASASDLGTDQPWIPSPGELDDFADSMNAALAADFRLVVHHFAVDISNVFGRESIPDFSSDFERLDDKILQAFGMSKTMLNGASSGQTYAADALNRDFVTQSLTVFQRRMQRFVRHRAAVVAEAQGHYDFEMKGGRPRPIMEEIVVTNELGERRIVQQPKLLLPELKLRAMNLKDEDKAHEFIESLREAGVPISMKTRLTNIPIDLDEEVMATRQEQVDQAVAAQETRKDTYLALKRKGLPIPPDLKQDFEPKMLEALQDNTEGDQAIPTSGVYDPAATVALAPTEEDLAEAAMAADEAGESPSDAVKQLVPRNRLVEVQPGAVPPESHEQRADMPRAAALTATSMRAHHVAVSDEAHLPKIEQEDAVAEVDAEAGEAIIAIPGPRHLALIRNELAFFLADSEAAS